MRQYQVWYLNRYYHHIFDYQSSDFNPGLKYNSRMLDVKITAVKKVCHKDLIEKYENSIEHACDVKEGDEWISKDGLCPQGFCQSAWMNLQPFVFALASGAENFYDGWMKNRKSAMISFNDGCRPVSFYIKVLGE